MSNARVREMNKQLKRLRDLQKTGRKLSVLQWHQDFRREMKKHLGPDSTLSLEEARVAVQLREAGYLVPRAAEVVVQRVYGFTPSFRRYVEDQYQNLPARRSCGFCLGCGTNGAWCPNCRGKREALPSEASYSL